MLLDASPTTWPATVCSVPAYEPVCAVFHDPSQGAERLDVFPAFAAVSKISSLGHVPMAVVTAAHRVDPTLATDELARLDSVWGEGMKRWAGLSSSSKIVTVEHTGHHIELDQPQTVLRELLELLP